MRRRPAQGPRRTERVWVVAADAARARIFEATRRNGSLVETATLFNPAARQPMRERVSDRQGHANTSARGGGHSMQRNATVEHDVGMNFARQLGRRLCVARRRGDFDRLYLLAEPRFLGGLRRNLDATTRRQLSGEIARDVSRHDAREIRRRLPTWL